ncbi:MAG: YeeE/YedE thiosulfate transporter family protein [Sphingomonas sp.]
MMAAPLSLGFLVAFIAAALIGYAVQRGATCLVAAVDEVVTKRKAKRLIALGEAAIWVAGGMLLLHLAGLMAMPSRGIALSTRTMVGGVLLGVGAVINGACVFGAVARIGSGDWAYWLTPVGFVLGCYGVAALGMHLPPAELTAPSALLPWAFWIAIPIIAFAAWRGSQLVRAGIRGELARFVWHPHQATALIGVSYVVMLPLVGAWAYTDALADLATGRTTGLALRLALLVALLLGAMLGGWTAGRLRWVRPKPVTMARCFTGGLLLGLGGLVVPGSNDGLILFAMPLLFPYAWAAVGSMAVSIWLLLALKQRLAAR